MSDFQIRLLSTPQEMASINTVLQQVWGTTQPVASVELLTAVAHAGGYVAACYESGRVMGASFGFLARHEGEQALHSHITGILPGIQHGGVGRAMKQHQREWAAERGIAWITWTFDPLMRRNAWFNIEVLGARIVEYLIDFYGPMSDSINTQDESDRLLVAWPSVPDAAPDAARRTPPPGPRHVIATPEDIVVLRRTDPDLALEWRRRVRHELGELIDAGGVVTDFTRDGEYIVHGG
jgi:predicted GNAT superfamily acetyltransferase